MMQPDFQIINAHSLIGFNCRTPAALEWFRENTNAEAFQWMRGTCYVEPRYAEQIIAGLIDAGFSVVR